VRGGVPALLLVAATTACGSSGSQTAELGVTRATLTPGHIALLLENNSADAARVEQVILNDSFVDFWASKAPLRPGDSELITVNYPWIEGESYDLELLTATGATVGYEIEDAETA
jgi:ZIP family zinc transporter